MIEFYELESGSAIREMDDKGWYTIYRHYPIWYRDDYPISVIMSMHSAQFYQPGDFFYRTMDGHFKYLKRKEFFEGLFFTNKYGIR